MKIINFFVDKFESTDPTHQNQISNLKKQFQSSNVNILLGAGFSYGVAELLGNIEQQLTDAESSGDQELILSLKKDFFTKSILPTIDASKLEIGEAERVRFFSLLKRIIENRQSSILHKIINVFTTNYDLLIESACEHANAEYIDGFSGRLTPSFSTANYGVILSRQTSISSMTSEVVTFNLYKVHGSLNWKCENDKIVRNNHHQAITEINNHLHAEDFETYYSNLSIINPTKAKLQETVLNVNYYDQLRMYCNELEKRNTLLIAFGFSFADEHILQMTTRALKGNPTFSLIIFSFNSDSTQKYTSLFEQYPNVSIFQLLEDDKSKSVVNFSQKFVNDILEEVYNGTK